MTLRRLSLWFALFPRRFIDPSGWDEFDLQEWSEDVWEYEPDGPFIWHDTVTPPEDTVVSGRGDCDDYALVAAHWALANERPYVGVATMGPFKMGVPVPRHMVAFDLALTYSSGDVHAMNLTEYVQNHPRYSWSFSRMVSSHD